MELAARRIKACQLINAGYGNDPDTFGYILFPGAHGDSLLNNQRFLATSYIADCIENGYAQRDPETKIVTLTQKGIEATNATPIDW